MPQIDALKKLQEVLDRLLDPENGCPWDLSQTPQSMISSLLEEVYELMAAMEENDLGAVKDELGDCLFNLSLISRLYKGQNRIDISEVILGAVNKIIYRHPHVFGDGKKLEEPDQVVDQWHQLKQTEGRTGSHLSSVPKAMPALMQAHRLGQKASVFGFDWENAASALNSVSGELTELEETIKNGDQSRTAEEIGDVLFTLVNLSRHLNVKAEDALNASNRKFRRRFEYIEQKLAIEGRSLDDADLDEMDRLWDEAKATGL